MKVAAYCRVSTDSRDQANSFESQQRYFREYIGRQDGWELHEIYADEGVTGTSTEKRISFNRMIRDARAGAFALILTKEVSRFSRNILDTIRYTRLLRSLGVGVVFLNDGISTLDPDAELRLSIMGSLAQEESRRTSSRVKWGQARRMEQGVVFGRSLLGYDVKDGKMTVEPEGAEIVRTIFHKYVRERKGTTVIARELRKAGCKTLSGSTSWRNTGVLKILKNEKYCGDLKQKKTITPDYLTHRKKYNCGEEDFVYIKDHHEPIVSRALWEAAQSELARRDVDGRAKSGHGNRYPLSGKIKCAVCGKSFVSRMRKRRDGTKYRVWRCGTSAADGRPHIDPAGNETGCGVGFQLRDDAGLSLVRSCIGSLQIDRKAAAERLVKRLAELLQADERPSPEKLKAELKRLGQKKKDVLDAFFEKSISRDDMLLMNGEYDRRISELNERLAEAERADPNSELEAIRKEVNAILDAPSRAFCGALLEHITVYPDRTLEVKLKALPMRWRYRQ